MGGGSGGYLIDDSERGLTSFVPTSSFFEPVFVNTFEDQALGVRVVDSKELTSTITKIMNMSTGGHAATARADYDRNPQLPLDRQRNSHWDSEQDRLLYLRCYFEIVSAKQIGQVDRDFVFGSMMAYEIDRQKPQLVISNPPTPKEKQQLVVLRAVARYEADQREAARETAQLLREFLEEVKLVQQAEAAERLRQQTRVMQVQLRNYPRYTHGPAVAAGAIASPIAGGLVKVMKAVLEIANVVLDFIPGISFIKGVAEGIIGYDLTGRKLEAWERGLGAVLSIVPSAKTIFKAGRQGVRAMATLGVRAIKEGRKAEDVFHIVQVSSKLDASVVRAAMIKSAKPTVQEIQAIKVMVGHLDEMQGLSARSWRAASGTIDNGVSTSRTASGVIDTTKRIPGKVIEATKASKAVATRLTKAGVAAEAIAELEKVGVAFSRRLVAQLARNPDAVSFVNRFYKSSGFHEVVKDLGVSASKIDGALFSMRYANKHIDPRLAMFELPAGITKRAKSTEVAARRVDITVRADKALGQAESVSHELKSWDLYTLQRALKKPTQLVKDTAIFGRANTRWVFNSAKLNKKQVVAEFKKAITADPYLKLKFPTGDALDKALDDLIVMFP